MNVLNFFRKKISRDRAIAGNKVAKIADGLNINILDVNGKSFVSGLYWKGIENPRATMQEARRFGREEGLDIVAIRSSVHQIQAGYVTKQAGASKQMYSLANAISGILERDEESIHKKEIDLSADEQSAYMVILEIPPECLNRKGRKKKNDDDEMFFSQDSSEKDKLYYLVVTADGTITPGSDKVGTFEEIKGIALTMRSLFHPFKKVFAPERFCDVIDVDGSLDIYKFLLPDKLLSEYKLKQLTFGLTKKELFFIAFFVIVALALSAWKAHQVALNRQAEENIRKAREALLKQQAEDIKKQTGVNVSENDLEKPWVTQPSLNSFLEYCDRQLQKTPVNIGGWKQVGAECQEKLVKSFYARMPYTTVDDFIDESKRIFGITPDIDKNGNAGSISFNVSIPPAGKEEIISSILAMSKITSLFQRLNLNYDFKQEVIQNLPGQVENGIQNKPRWEVNDFTVESKLPPALIFDGFYVPVVRLTSISVSWSQLSNFKWVVKGKVYVESKK